MFGFRALATDLVAVRVDFDPLPANMADTRVAAKLERELAAARTVIRATGYAREASEAVHALERRVAEAKGEEWAEPLDLGVHWDGGAPLPHVISDGTTSVVICLESTGGENADELDARFATPPDQRVESLLLFWFEGCHSIRFGGPNDEAQPGHPLATRGLGHSANMVHNSSWLAEEERINQIHPYHSPKRFRQLRHYLFSFKEELFEALASDVHVEQRAGVFADVFIEIARGFVSPA